MQDIILRDKGIVKGVERPFISTRPGYRDGLRGDAIPFGIRPTGRVEVLGSDLAFDETIRLKSAFAGQFGTKAEPTQRLWDSGDRQYFAGVRDNYFEGKINGFILPSQNIDADNPWMGGAPMVDRNTTRHPYENFSYQLNDGAGTTIGWHKALGGEATTEQADCLYLSFYRKDSSPFFAFRYRDLGTIESGAFIYSADEWGVGEPIRMETPNGNVHGFVIRALDDGSIEYVVNRGLIGDTRAVSRVVGVISGAVFVPTEMSLTYPAPSSTKILRIWDGRDDTQPDRNRWASWTSDMMGLSNMLDYRDAYFMGVEEWAHYECYIRVLDRVNCEFEFTTRINGKVFQQNRAFADPAVYNMSGGYAPNIALLGQDPNREVNSRSHLSSIYADWTAKRVMLGDASEYEFCSVREPQRLLDWTPDAVDIAFSPGALDITKPIYAFVFDDRDQIIDQFPFTVEGAAENAGTAALKWNATTGLVEDGLIEIETDGTFDFGETGPELIMLMEPHRLAAGEMTIDDLTFGQTVRYAEFDALGNAGFTVDDSVTGLPNSKAVVMGGVGSGQNPSDKPGGLTVKFDGSAVGFEARTLYWPQDKQDAAEPYLRRQVAGFDTEPFTWQCKPIWNMADRDYLGTDTDFFNEPGLAIADSASFVAEGTQPYFKTGTLVSSNSITTVYQNHLLNNPLDDIKRIYAEPIQMEYWFDQGDYSGVANGKAGILTSTVVQGVKQFIEVPNLQLAEETGQTRIINSFTYPGFIRGFNVELGLNYYDFEVYKTAGPGAYCRVAICDNADYFQATKRVILEPKHWRQNKIVARLRETWFDLSTLKTNGLWLCIIGADNQQIASIQF